MIATNSRDLKPSTRTRYRNISTYCNVHGLARTIKHYKVSRNTVATANRLCGIKYQLVSKRRRYDAYQMIMTEGIPYAKKHTDYSIDELNRIYFDFARLSPEKRAAKIADAKRVTLERIDKDHAVAKLTD